jgi:hypothetical protein
MNTKTILLEILNDIIQPLIELGLYVDVKESGIFDGNYLHINDSDKNFCKNYPKDELDWLLDKKCIKIFLKQLNEITFDYMLYGGGLDINIIFSEKVLKNLIKKHNRIKRINDVGNLSL